jgi:hypothetical protein
MRAGSGREEENALYAPTVDVIPVGQAPPA